MRNLFIVLAKVVGLLQISTTISYLYVLNGYLAEVGYSEDWLAGLCRHLGSIIGTCVNMGLILGFVWVLLFYTNWIADRLGLPEGELDVPEPSSFLRIGIKLLGIYVLVEAVPSFIWVMIEPRAFDPDQSAAHFWIRIVPTVLKFGFGLILVGKTTSIMELISRDAKPKDIVSA